jgi:hypothetical protein
MLFFEHKPPSDERPRALTSDTDRNRGGTMAEG